MQEDSRKQPGQLGALEKLGRGKGKMQAAQAQPSTAPDVGPLLMRSYMDERAKRLLYADKGLHVLVCCKPHELSSCMHDFFLSDLLGSGRRSRSAGASGATALLQQHGYHRIDKEAILGL